MSWFWQLRGHQRDAREWSTAVTELGPDPFEAPVRPAVPLADPCVDLPPPWSEEQVWEARRGVRLLRFASGTGTAGDEGDGGSGDSGGEFWGSAGTRAYLARIVAAYRADLPQVCRRPGVMWFFAGLIVGEWRSMGEALDAMVDACRARPGRGWDLGLARTLRGRMLDTGPDNEDRAARDADEAVSLLEGTGDLVILAESLAGGRRGNPWPRGAYRRDGPAAARRPLRPYRTHRPRPRPADHAGGGSRLP
ncbi:hypothetical protein ACIBBB_06860 [Streptomyces sp. NPDC051217]|uniref:hypothetical protein n=1 Tax=Streptomyces sp. NPDC051217 TaxID=3365644 RepID=UPI0037A955FD